MKRLVFVHGRSQEGKDSAALKEEWVRSWRLGLAKNALDMPIADLDIKFPYFGQTLYDLAKGVPTSEIAAMHFRGTFSNADQRDFVYEWLSEMQRTLGITDADVLAEAGSAELRRGVLNWEWVQALLAAVDRRVPLASGTAIALGTNDVFQYLDNIGVRDEIEVGVRRALNSDVPTVVVAHSLGTIVSYNLLRRDGASLGWKVPLFVTLGSPLGVTAIRKKLSPLHYPECVGKWLNALDPRDVVALYPLDEHNFGVDLPVENKVDIDNPTKNRHGIAGYLSDPIVARRIYDALV